jgi:hypothetical protein
VSLVLKIMIPILILKPNLVSIQFIVIGIVIGISNPYPSMWVWVAQHKFRP